MMHVTSARAFGRTMLWAVVNELCVPGFLKNDNAFPCLAVDGDVKAGGIAIVPDLWSSTHVLAVPTIRVSGIESAAVLSGNASHWFEGAWKARGYVYRNLGRTLPNEDIALAVNSRLSRTQDQLHIHIDCIRPDIRIALERLQPELSTEWSASPVTLNGKHYFARLLRQSDLEGVNPFRIVADGPGRGERNLAHMTIAIAAAKLNADGFILLTGRGHAEDLLDHSCAIAHS
jgi:CDP-diacylglycerol pyrophosphatase